MDAQFKKGILEMCLLHKLSQNDYYGYSLMREMRLLFPEVNDSTFYAILRRLNKEGMTSIYYGEASGGPKRKYYSITETGLESLEKNKEAWNRLKKIVSEIGI